MNQAWGKYYKGQRKELIFIAIGLSLTAASIALSVPSAGASIAVTVAAGAKSIAEAVKKLSECWRTAEEQRQKVETSIRVLLAAYVKSVHAGRAVQISGSVLDAIGILPVAEALPFMRNQLLPSVTRIKADMETHKGKLAHLYVEANRLCGQLFELLDQIDDWQKQNPGQTMPGLPKIEKRIEQLLDSGVRKLMFRNKLAISGAYSRYEAGMTAHEVLLQQFQQLNGLETNPRAIAIVQGVIKIIGKLAYLGAGYGTALDLNIDPNAIKDLHAGVGTAVSSLTATVTGDAIGTTNDFIEFSEVVKGDEPPGSIHTMAHQVMARYAALPVVPPPRPQRLQVTRATAPKPPPRTTPPAGGRALPTPTAQQTARSTAPQRPARPPRPFRSP